MNSRNKNASAIIAIVFLLTSVRINLHPPVNAQTIGDTLPTRIPTPTYTLSPSSSPNQPQVWVGRLASDTLGVTEGQGSIIRVSVNGLPDTAIELNNGSQLITAKSGTKPEYGPYAAEFAPVPAGIWTISVPALGASINVETDNYNLAIIEFVQVPASAATQVVLPTVTATPLGAVEWEGQIVSETAGKNVPFARLLIQVAGRNGQPVQLATLTQVVNTAFTGQKPDELGPNMVEFAGLTPGRYFVDPLGLNVSLPVELKPNTETRVEFQPKVVTPTPLPTATETPTSIPVPPTTTFVPTKTATPTPLPTQTATPLPLPTPVTQWVGAIEARTDRGSGLSAIIVKVTGAKTVPITLNAGPRPDANCVTNAEQSLCQFTGLLPGTYTVAPQGLGIILPVTVSGHELVQIIFNKQSFPAGVTGWQAQITRNSNGGLATALAQGIITANVEGQPGQIISLRSTQPGQRQFCEVAQTPDGLGCQFTNLGPGIYTIEALNTQARLKLFVDGVGQATVKFTPNATYATQELNKQPAVVGKGASPKRPTVVAAAPLPLPTFTPTVTPPAQPTRTPTPALGWQGRVVGSDVTGAGAIAVRSAGLKDHPVIVRSGDWQSNPQLTGTKPEWGDYATEFGGLSPGEYVVELVDLAELKIILEGGQFLLIEFRYDVISSP